MKKIVKLVNVNFKKNFNNNAQFKEVEIDPDIKFGFINETGGSWNRYKVKELLNTHKPVAQDKSFYRYPKLTLPRDKFQVIKEKYNSTITRKKDMADYKIISDKFVNSLYEGSWNHWITYNDFVAFWNKVNHLFDVDCTNVIHNLIESGNDTYVYNVKGYASGYYNTSSFSQNEELAIKYIHDQYIPIEKEKYFHIIDLKQFKEIYLSKNLVLDEDILDFATEDSVVLDEEAFKTLESMCASNDESNLAIALEMMANCNVRKSFDIIAYMFWFYNDNIRYAKNWQSVNVKSLKKVFSQYQINSDHNRSGSYKNLLRKLLRDSACTEFIKKKIKNKYFNKVVKLWITDTGPFDVSIDNFVFKDLNELA